MYRFLIFSGRFINQVRLNWDNAEAECASAAPSGKTGHLVAIDSAAENEWVHDWWVSMLSPLSGTSFEVITVLRSYNMEELKVKANTTMLTVV